MPNTPMELAIDFVLHDFEMAGQYPQLSFNSHWSIFCLAAVEVRVKFIQLSFETLGFVIG